MEHGMKALLSGFLAFVVATIAFGLFDRDGNRIDAMTIGGLTGGAVAFSVWITTRWNAAERDGTTA